MSRISYTRPPVHEVVIAINFASEVDVDIVRQMRKTVSKNFEFDVSHPVGHAEMQVHLPGSPELPPEIQRTSREVDGWLFRDEEPGRVLQVRKDRFVLHVLRPGALLPEGEYAGWESIRSTYEEIHSELTPYLGDVPLQRLGLRYLNRLAVPKSEHPVEWFTLRLEAPSILQKPYAFSLRQTWEDVGEGADLSATIGLQQFAVPEEEDAPDRHGVLLDIDIFNLWTKDASPYPEMIEWIERAHKAENKVFESCLTTELRETFGGTNA